MLILSETSGVAAFAAKFFCGFSVLKTMVNGLGTGSFQNFFQRLLQNIAQSKISLVIQAAGDNRAVTENTDLVSQSI